MAKTISLNDLLKQYNSTPVYKQKTAAQIKKQAKGEYKSYYDQLRLSAKQQQQQSDLALQQQRDALQATYDKQREASEKNYRLRYSQADRQMLSRGMQRSSYGAQVLANIDLEGAEAIQDLYDQQGAAEGNIDAQRAQLAQQLAAQLSQYNAGEAADVMKRIRELEDQDYERGLANAQNRNQLSTQIYQLMYQAERDKVADKQWQAQFDESVRQFNVQQAKKSSGGGGSSGWNNKKKKEPVPQGQPGPDPYEGRYGSDYDSWLAGMNGEGEYDPNYRKNLIKEGIEKDMASVKALEESEKMKAQNAAKKSTAQPKAPTTNNTNTNTNSGLTYHQSKRINNDKINRAI